MTSKHVNKQFENNDINVMDLFSYLSSSLRLSLSKWESIDIKRELILIHDCLSILYPSAIQKASATDYFSFLLSDFIIHF